jgi:tetratricopeptide (TPR) repeat protein
VNGIKTSEQARSLVDSIDQSDLLTVSKVALPVSVRRTIAQSLYRNWKEETLLAHDQARETLELCKEFQLANPNELELKAEEVQLNTFLGLCIHKSGEFRADVMARYPGVATEDKILTVVAQSYFTKAIDEFEQLPAEFRQSDRGLELLLTVLERKGLSDVQVQREKAISTFEDAIKISRDLVNRYPLSRERRIRLASLLNSQADQFFGVDSDVAIRLRVEGKEILQNQLSTSKDRIAEVFTLISVRLARDLFLQSDKERAIAILREVFDLYGTLHHGEPLASEFLGYAVLYDEFAIKNDQRSQLRVVELAQEYLKTVRSPVDKASAPELYAWLNQVPECIAFRKLEPINSKLHEMGFE